MALVNIRVENCLVLPETCFVGHFSKDVRISFFMFALVLKQSEESYPNKKTLRAVRACLRQLKESGPVQACHTDAAPTLPECIDLFFV